MPERLWFMNSADTIVKLSGVNLRYGSGESSVLAIQDVDFEVGRGEFVAVVGRSGCGKSSLLKLISGLQPATQGEVLIDGAPVRGPVGIVGMAFQNACLLPWRKVLANVLLPLEVVRGKRRDYRRNPKPYIERAHELLETVGLDGFANSYPWQLSGGMRQRVSLCRALIHEPELLLLDEPFGALDAFTREELWQVLQRLRFRTGCSVVLITHDLSEAVYLADRIYAMSQRPGTIVARKSVLLEGDRRDLDIRYTPMFTETVAEIRHNISGQADPVAEVIAA